MPRFRKRKFAQPVLNSSPFPAMNSFSVEPGLLIKLSTAILSFETNFVKSKSCLKIRSICGTISVVTFYILQSFRSKISRLRNISCKFTTFFLVEGVWQVLRKYEVIVSSIISWTQCLRTVAPSHRKLKKNDLPFIGPRPIIVLPDSCYRNHCWD